MTTEGDFQALVQQVRDLLECGAAGLLLGCPDEALRHPLLDVFIPVQQGYAGCYGAEEVLALLESEWVRALLDMALQSGRLQCSGCIPRTLNRPGVRSLAVAPLERPAGVLGLLLLIDAHGGAFCAGERSVLTAALQRLSRKLEHSLRRLYRASLSPRAGRLPLSLVVRGPVVAHAGRGQPESELDQVRNEFISMVSHELRSPLTAIKGYAGLLQAYGLADVTGGGEGEPQPGGAALSGELQRHYLTVIMEQVSHLEALAGDLLDISRIHANHLALRCARLDVAALCLRVVELTRQRVEREAPGKYRLCSMVEEQLPPAWADADRVQQILTNLLENAVKYSPDGGRIEVRIEVCPASRRRSVAVERWLRISVSDEGIGISAEQQARLFKPFSRLEQPVAGCVPGVGLGLYITRKLVEALGGSIELESREGEGTRVTFTLPVAERMEQ
jgi:signal transduction histidine kinase